MKTARTRANRALIVTLSLLTLIWSTGFGLIQTQQAQAAPGSWPAAWNTVTQGGVPVTDEEGRAGCLDTTTGGPANGGSAVQPAEADIGSEADCKNPDKVNPGTAPSMYFVYSDVLADTVDCLTTDDDELYFRTRYAGDPRHNSAINGLKNTVWETHLDVTGDGVADYHIVVDGNPQQSTEIIQLVDASYTEIWSATTDPAVGYVRVTATPETPPGDDSSHEEYFMDIQIPVSAFPDGVICSGTSITVNQVTTAQESNDPTGKDSLLVGPADPIDVGDGINLAIDKTVDDDAPLVGSQVVFTISVTNDGPDDATGVTVDDILPAGLTYVSDDSVGDYDDASGVWTIGTLLDNETVTLMITAGVDDGTAGSTIINTAETQAEQDEANETDNVDTAEVMPWQEPPQEGLDLAVTKVVDNSAPVVGTQATYTITVSNEGSDDATGVVVDDVLPVGVTYVSDDSGGDYDDDSGVWTIGDLAVGDSISIDILVDVDPGTTGQTINNEACVSSDGRDVDPSDDCADVDITPDPVVVVDPQSDDLDIAVIETVSDPTPSEGDTISFTISALNGGPIAATGLALSVTLPAGVTFVSSAGVGSYNPASNLWTIGNLGVGNSAVLTISVTVDAGADGQTLASNAQLASVDQNDTDPSNNQADASITVAAVVSQQEPAQQEYEPVTPAASLAETGVAGYLPMLIGALLLAGLTIISFSSSQPALAKGVNKSAVATLRKSKKGKS
ncbi:MAG: DUF11 domain-containing protein [bacterium]|nr:DUF11 domain-containing protein [bacterium]